MTKINIALIGMMVVMTCAGGRAEVAGLRFDATAQDLSMKMGQTNAQFTFEFFNQSEKEIRIVDVVAGCGCTSFKLSADRVPPKSGGKVAMTVDLRGKTQPRISEAVTLITDESGVKPYVLTGNIANAPTISLHPRILIWQSGEATVPKRVRLAGMTAALAKELIVEKRGTGAEEVSVEVISEGDGETAWIEVRPIAPSVGVAVKLKPKFSFGGGSNLPEVYVMVPEPRP